MGGPAIGLLFVLIFLILGALYTLTLQNTFKQISPQNRELDPYLVWLIFIPLFNFIWQFVIVYKLSASINKEILSRNGEVKMFRPTFGSGIIAAIGWSGYFVVNTFGGRYTPFAILSGLLALAAFIGWLVYWIQVAQYKRKLKALKTEAAQ